MPQEETCQAPRISRRLGRIRADSGLSEEDFAARVTAGGFPVTGTTVANYESGKSKKVPTDYAATVCRIFGWSVAWLVAEDGPERPVAPELEVRAFRAMAAIADRVRARADDEDALDLAEWLDGLDDAEGLGE